MPRKRPSVHGAPLRLHSASAVGFRSRSVRACGLLFTMLCDEIVDPQAHGPRGTVLVVALEVHHVLADYDLARFLEQEAVHLAVARRPGVKDDAGTIEAVLVVGQPGAPFDPRFGLIFAGYRPAQESLDLVLDIDHEVIVLAVDLPDQDARPLAEAQPRKGRFGH